MGSGNVKWHVHCSVCGAFLEKSAQSDSEVDCKKCKSTLEVLVKDDIVFLQLYHQGTDKAVYYHRFSFLSAAYI